MIRGGSLGGHLAVLLKVPIKPGTEECCRHASWWQCQFSSSSVEGKHRGQQGRVQGFEAGAEIGSCWGKIWEERVLSEDVEALGLVLDRPSPVPVSLIDRLLRRCIAEGSLVLGRRVHALALRCGLECNMFLANHFIRMYASHGRLEEATQVFSKLATPGTYLWSCIISAYADHGEVTHALGLYQRMTTRPDDHTFVAILKACARAGDLASGRKVHADILGAAVEPNVFVGNCLVDMYVKCGRLEDARKVFYSLSTKDVVTWTTMVGGYAKHGFGQEALSLYADMQQEGVCAANHITFACLLKACASILDLPEGKRLHSELQERGLETNLLIGNCLVDMYAKCGSLEDACKVFDNLPVRDVVTWNALIAGYVQHGRGQESLTLFARMQQAGIHADQVTFASLLKACASIRALREGKSLHRWIKQRGHEDDVVIGNCLVDMYARCGILEDARRVFDRLRTRNVITWTVMIAAYADQGFGQECLCLYARMQQEGIARGDPVTFSCLLKACGCIPDLHRGRQVHAEIMSHGLDSDVIIGNCLVAMYAKCGSLLEARKVFDRMPTRDVVTWTVMISRYAEHGLGQESLALYASMQQEGITPVDKIALACLLTACAGSGDLQLGKQLHSQIQQQGLEADTHVGNCLVDMYANCGSLEDARRVFNSIPMRDVVSWTALIAAYSEQGLFKEALILYARMLHEDMTPPDSITFACLLKGCASLGRLHQGKELHAQIQKQGLEGDELIGNCLVDMYAKCGSLEESCRVFSRLAARDVVTWNAMIGGYAQHGHGQEAVQCYERMCFAGIKPDAVTFLSLLTACSRAGLADKGAEYFQSMSTAHGLTPQIEHYVCMVDLFGSAGKFARVEKLLMTMPMEPDLALWVCLLAACRRHGNVVLGERAFRCVVDEHPKHSAAYVLMSHIYADAGLLHRAGAVQALRRKAGAWKDPGHSWIELETEVHRFLTGDRSPTSALAGLSRPFPVREARS